jgi:hypothetical protein
MKLFSLIRIALFVSAGGYCSTALGADEELLRIVAQKLASHSNQSIAPYLDRTSDPDPSLPTMQKLKKISAFGMIFSGSVEVRDGQFNRVSYRTDDSKVDRAVAETALKAIAFKLQQTLGPAKVAEVPNFDDGPPTYRVCWWRTGDEVVLLFPDIYSGATVNLVRVKQAAWFADMGAGEHEFWEETLKASKD